MKSWPASSGAASSVSRKEGSIAIDSALVLEQMRNTVALAAKAYRRFIEDGQNLGHDERYYQAVDQRFLGDEKFIQKIVERVPQAEIRPGTEAAV